MARQGLRGAQGSQVVGQGPDLEGPLCHSKGVWISFCWQRGAVEGF